MLFQHLCQGFFKQPKTLIHDTSCLSLPSFMLHSASSPQLCCLQLVLLWLVSAPHLEGGVQTRTQFPEEAPLCQAEPKDYCVFPTGSWKPGLGADMAVPLPVPELSHSFGYL